MGGVASGGVGSIVQQLSRATENCPWTAMRTARWWPRFLPMGGHRNCPGLGQGRHPRRSFEQGQEDRVRWDCRAADVLAWHTGSRASPARRSWSRLVPAHAPTVPWRRGREGQGFSGVRRLGPLARARVRRATSADFGAASSRWVRVVSPGRGTGQTRSSIQSPFLGRIAARLVARTR